MMERGVEGTNKRCSRVRRMAIPETRRRRGEDRVIDEFEAKEIEHSQVLKMNESPSKKI